MTRTPIFETKIKESFGEVKVGRTMHSTEFIARGGAVLLVDRSEYNLKSVTVTDKGMTNS